MEQAPQPALPPPPRVDLFERERRQTHRVLLFLMVTLVFSSLAGVTPNIDLGVFATLLGGDLAVLGAGAVIKLVGPK